MINDNSKFTWHANEITWLEAPTSIEAVFHRGCNTPHLSVKDVRLCPRWIAAEGRRWVGFTDYAKVTYMQVKNQEAE
jgi:hypothetical protein